MAGSIPKRNERITKIMGKILTIKELIKVSNELKNKGKRIVLAGGCFDIVHIGHIEFLKRAKEKGDVLIILLESDQSIRKAKGNNRPIHSQEDRSVVLSALEMVDYVLLLPQLDNTGYDDIIARLAPNVIATTYKDPQRFHKERQAKLIGATVIDVIRPISKKSSSIIAKLLAKDL